MLRALRILLASLAAAGLAVTWLYAVPASSAYAQSQPPDASDQTPNISDQKLDAAASAIQQVAGIKEDYQQRLEAAAPSDRERIADEAKTAMVKAVTDQGLSLQEYSSILVVAQKDADVREKIVQRLRPSDK